MRLGAYLIIVTLCLIAGSVQLYGYCRFKSLRNLIIIRKRYPSFVLTESIACIILLVLGVPLLHPSWTMYFPNSSSMYHTLHLMGRVLIILPADVIGYTETARLWLICYDLQYLKSSKEDVWKSKIDASNTHNDWYLYYRSKWGNARVIALCAFGIFVFTASISISTIFLHEVLPSYLLHVLRLCAFIVPFLVLGWLYWNYPRNLDDAFYFEFEFRATACSAIICFLLFVVSAVIQILLDLFTLDYFLELIMAILLSFPSLVSTIWIPHKIQLTQRWNEPLRLHQHHHLRRQRLHDEVMMVRVHSERSAKNEKLSPHLNDAAMTPSTASIGSKLRSTFSDETKFESLVDWMHKEFSSETILCFIECVQYKQRVKQYISSQSKSRGIMDDGTDDHNDDTFEDGVDSMDYVFYDEIPKSSIVWTDRGKRSTLLLSPSNNFSVRSPSMRTEKEDLNGLKLKAHLLFEKYIKVRSELEINIAGSLRERYHNLDAQGFESLDAAELVTLFDDVMKCLMRYIRESFIRFDIHCSHLE